MDTVDYKSTGMGSAVLMVAAGALVGAVVAVFFSRRPQPSSKPASDKNDSSVGDDDDNKKAADSVHALRAELDDCRRMLDEFRLRLEQETERRAESEAWNRKLEQDVVDLAAARRGAEEKCMRLLRDLDRVRDQLEDAEAEASDLRLEIKRSSICSNSSLIEGIGSSSSDIVPSVAHKLATSAPNHIKEPPAVQQKPKVPPKTKRQKTTAFTTGDGSREVSLNFSLIRDNNGSKDVSADTNSVAKSQSPSSNHLSVDDHTNITSRDSDNEEEEDFYLDDSDNYSDEDDDDLEELNHSDIAILQRSISQVSEDNFELGSDVIGALIANAFKDGVINSSREGDDLSSSADFSSPQQPTHPGQHGGEHGPDQGGEVSQESIGDIKTTRRFWEQIIAADKVDDDDDVMSDEDDNVTYDYEDDVTNEEDDFEKEEFLSKDSRTQVKMHLNHTNDGDINRHGSDSKLPGRLSKIIRNGVDNRDEETQNGIQA